MFHKGFVGGSKCFESAGCLFLVEFLQTRQSTFKISCQIAVIRDTDTQQNVILNTFLKIIIPLAEINQAV